MYQTLNKNIRTCDPEKVLRFMPVEKFVYPLFKSP